MQNFWHYCSEYGRYYSEHIRDFWMHLRPSTYTGVLLTVWLIGFLLLKSGARR